MASKFSLKIAWLTLIIFLGSLTAVYAQGPIEEEAPIIVAPSGQLNVTLKQLNYENETLTREKSREVFDVNLPGNFQLSPTGNYLDLITNHLPETPEKPSVLYTKVNNRLVSTLVLTKTNAVSNVVRLELPDDVLQTGRNLIEFNLDTGATCEDPGAFVNVLINANSGLSFGYQQNPYRADLALYPFPFVEQSLLNIPVTLVLPDQPTTDDLTAAATVAAGLGQASQGAIDLTTVTVSSLTPDIQNNNHLIVIGLPDANDLYDELDLPVSIDQTTLKSGQGILQEVVSPWNEFRLILVVSGLDGEGLLKASNALNRQAHFLGMRGPVAVVIELGSLPPQTDSQRNSSFSLAGLNYENEVIYGTLPQEVRFDFNLPRAWQLKDPPFFVLKFAHADILLPESALDVSLNDVPIGSTLLDDSNADEGELTISLPDRLLEAGRNRLKINVEMRLPDLEIGDRCGGVGDERAWIVISNESEIFLSYNPIDLEPNLRLFPYPFSQFSGFDQVAFLLPDQLSTQFIDQLMQLAVQMGSASQPGHISPQVGYAADVDQEVTQNHHLILLGLPTENSLLAELNPSLPQPFVAGSDILEPLVVDNVAFLPNPGRDAGILEIIQSPWNEKYTILALTGTTADGVELAIQTLLHQPGELKGNLAVVEPALNPFSNQPGQISTYSVDTRQAAIRASSGDDNAMSEAELSDLANRWWK